MSAPVIGFAGMTHLGLVSAVATAARGFDVIGYDADERLVRRLDCCELPILEPDLDRLLSASRHRICFSADARDLARSDVVYIAADVPTDGEGDSDLAPIATLVEEVSNHLRDAAVLVVLCQVSPGFTRSIATVPHNRLFYQVETLVFGRAVERALNPERFIVGCAEPAKPLPARYRQTLEAFGCPILPMRYESAELAKISINFCLVASITVANVLAELSESIGADWSEIVPALRVWTGALAPMLISILGLALPAGISNAIFAPCSISRTAGIPMSVLYVHGSRTRVIVGSGAGGCSKSGS